MKNFIKHIFCHLYFVFFFEKHLNIPVSAFLTMTVFVTLVSMLRYINIVMLLTIE